MKKIAIVTDSNSGITQEMGKTMGIHVIPMPFFIDGELFLEDITLTQEEFYKRLGEDSDISTSQPSPGEVMECWDELLKEYDEIVHIPMSSGLSSTCHAAQSLSQEYDGKVLCSRQSENFCDTEAVCRRCDHTQRSGKILQQRSKKSWKRKNCRQAFILQWIH